ncbi:innexin inx3-like [Argiope bruennichi]|uniref:Innexin n=1 Tax=Argiope bruennichi TaxID=94029 RepID=A0A8T0DZ42_ARGBR|nr:innexin inx3-like [Argiope bruennichi]KAF8763808.1 Innexin inx3 like protein [Argiope bruennichi]
MLIDNFIFHLHYRWTVILLLVCSFVITCKLVLGYSFSCLKVDGLTQEQLETYCYDHYVYTWSNTHPEFRKYQDFYPWVNLLFLVHAFNFYIPHLLWKYYDSDDIKRLADIEVGNSRNEKRKMKLCYLASYVLATQGTHKLYTGMYIFCECLNYAISLAQSLWLGFFFKATIVLKFLKWTDFQVAYFPSTGNCSITVDKVHHETSCFLPLNKLYMYMFFYVHSWYIVLTILSGTVLIYRLVLLVPSKRVAIMKFTAAWIDKETLKSLSLRLSYADWFFLTRFQRVLSDVDFAHLVEKIALLSIYKSSDGRDEFNTCLSNDGCKELENSLDISPVDDVI